MTGLWRLDATELAHAIRTRRFSSREAIASCLARRDRLAPAPPIRVAFTLSSAGVTTRPSVADAVRRAAGWLADGG